MWHCERRHYVGRGTEAEHRRQQVEGFILGRNLVLHNGENQPTTFAGPRGESNVDLTMSTRGVTVQDWRVLDGASSSDHRLITCRVGGAESTVARAEPVEEPVRFRDRGVDADAFKNMIQFRMGKSDGGPRPRARKRKACQRMKAVGGSREAAARADFQQSRGRYRRSMRETQKAYFVKIADNGNVNPWGIAYRAATGRCTAPRNIINGLALAEGFAGDTVGAMSGMLRPLCPDDDPARDTRYHALVKVMATMVPSGRDAVTVGGVELGRIVGSLSNTAPGMDEISAAIVKHLWRAVQPEFVRVYEKCVQEGVFPRVWKNGRLLVIPKGNGRTGYTDNKQSKRTAARISGRQLDGYRAERHPGSANGTGYGEAERSLAEPLQTTVRLFQRSYGWILGWLGGGVEEVHYGMPPGLCPGPHFVEHSTGRLAGASMPTMSPSLWRCRPVPKSSGGLTRP
ncbi:Retrovirus-related Pol polyprotein from type-1 retrotransposable element R1 [Eumeta japonica]|uniref:Retrovirus-related Pol polyprotein from type-1 retrotransposable element R1 n=1 Tax=Eumeta variegata TaxID=151549 RepID=A0A4C1XPX1_EUMVA|nr:Retrovirus-related Pol polyprotein from type-1 retrotransposable element R1 [Eumeta japonica]